MLCEIDENYFENTAIPIGGNHQPVVRDSQQSQARLSHEPGDSFRMRLGPSRLQVELVPISLTVAPGKYFGKIRLRTGARNPWLTIWSMSLESRCANASSPEM